MPREKEISRSGKGLLSDRRVLPPRKDVRDSLREKGAAGLTGVERGHFHLVGKGSMPGGDHKTT